MTEVRVERVAVAEGERGLALVVVMFVLIAVLAGGLAAVAIASAELSSTYGYRSRAVIDACADAAVEKVRAKLPEFSVEDIAETFTLPDGGTLTISAAHGALLPTDSPLLQVPGGGYDVAALDAGGSIGNSLGAVTGKRVLSVIATCTGPGNSHQEVQLVFTYGVSTGE